MSAQSSAQSSRSRFRLAISRVFGDQWFSQKVKLPIVVSAVLVLTYALCVSDPWKIFGFLSSETKRQFRTSDKLLHGFSYFVLALVFMWYAATKSRTVVLGLLAAGMLHGIATEFAQKFVPERSFDVSDMLADFIGVLLGGFLGIGLRQFVETDATAPVGVERDFSFGSGTTTSAGIPITDSALPESLGLARETLNHETVKEVQPRMLNLKFLGITVGTLGVFFGSVYAIHGWQVKRNAKNLLELGRKAHQNGNVKQAKQYFNRYVGMVPNDINALADFGLLLESNREGRKGSHRVFMVFEQVLRTDPTREDIRRKQVNVAMDLGRTSDALAHATILKQAHPKDGELHYLVGLCHEELREYEKAADAFQQAVALKPELIAAYSRLALIQYTQFENRSRADELFNELLKQNPESTDAYLARSKFFKDTNRFDLANQDMLRALTLAPEDGHVVLAAAELGYARAHNARVAGKVTLANRIVLQTRTLLENGIKNHAEHLGLRLQLVLLESHFGDADDALKQVDAILQASPSDARAQLLLADLTIERGDYERAEEALKQLPRTPMSDALRLFLRGRILMADTHYEQAVAQFENARRFMANAPSMLERTDLALAQCHASLKQTAAELADYRRILKYNPKSTPGRLGLAASYLRMQRLPEAIAEYKQMSKQPQVRLLLARLLIIQNMQLPEVARDWNEIRRLLAEARSAGDDPTQVVLLEAEILALQGQFEEARHVVESARANQTDRIEFLVALSRLANRTGQESQASLWMGQAMAAVGDNDQAEANLLKALQSDPRSAAAGQSLMRFYLKQGKREEAIAVFRKVARSLSRKELAKSYSLFGDLQNAVALFEQELVANPGDVSVLRSLADVYLRNGYVDRAEPLLRRLIDMASTIPESQLMQARRQLAVVLASRSQHQQFREALLLIEKNKQPDGKLNILDQRARASVLATSSNRADTLAAVKIMEQLEDRGQLRPADHWLIGRLYEQLDATPQATKHLHLAATSTANDTTGNAAHFAIMRQYVSHLIRIRDFEKVDQWLEQLESVDVVMVQEQKVFLAVARNDLNLAVENLQQLQAQLSNGAKPSVTTLIRVAKVATAALNYGVKAAPAEKDSNVVRQFAEKKLRQAAQQQPDQLAQLVTWLIQQDQSGDALNLVAELWKSSTPELAAGLSMTLLEKTNDESHFSFVERQVRAAIKSNPDSLNLRLFLADLFSLRNQIADAEELYRDLLLSDRNFVSALNNLAWLLAMDQRHEDEAMSLIERAIDIAGPLPQLLDTRGCVYTALGNTRRAIEDLQTSIGQRGEATTWLHLAAAHHLAGDDITATRALRRAKTLGINKRRMHPLEQRLFERLEKSLVK